MFFSCNKFSLSDVENLQHGPEFSVDTTWTELSHNIGEILNHRAANLSFEENHRYAYNMVLYKQGNTLYQGVKQIVTENLIKLAKENVIPLFPTKSVDSDDPSRSDEESALLKALRKVWDDHTSSMSRLAQILRYMVRRRAFAAGRPLLKSWHRIACTSMMQEFHRQPNLALTCSFAML